MKRNFSRIFMMNVISRLSGNLVRLPCHEDLSVFRLLQS
jgi:hypothetical protein